MVNIMNMTTRVERLDATLAEGRVIRREWNKERDWAYFFSGLLPEAGIAGQRVGVLGEVMPAWLALPPFCCAQRRQASKSPLETAPGTADEPTCSSRSGPNACTRPA